MSAKKVTVLAVAALLVVWLLVGVLARSDDGPRTSSADVAQPPVVQEPRAASGGPDEPEAAGRILVTGRCVELVSEAPVAGVVVHIGSARATTEADGRFSLPWPADAGAGLVAIGKTHARVTATLPVERRSVDVGTLLLRGLETLRGVVVSSNGEPVVGATVHLRALSFGGKPWDSEKDTVKTEAQGRFALVVPDEAPRAGPERGDGRFTVHAHAPGHLPAFQEVLDVSNDVRIELGRARTVTGIVLDRATGLPVAGARLFFSRRPRRAGLPIGETAADGTFSVGVYPPPGPGHIVSSLEAYADGYAPARIRYDLIRDDGNRVELVPAVRVKGRVVDDRGRPLGGVSVEAWRARPAKPPSGVAARRMSGWGKPSRFVLVPPACTRARTAGDGTFSVTLAGGQPFRIMAQAFPLKAVLEDSVPPSEAIELTLRPADGYHDQLDVRVVDGHGRAIRGGTVTWWAVPHADGKGMTRSPSVGARTGPDGIARVWTNRTWTRPVRFYAWAPGWFGVSATPVDRQAMTEPAEVVCRRTATIVGRVDAASIGPRTRVSIWRKVGGEWPWRVAYVRIARDGRFVVPDVTPGVVRLVVAGPSGEFAERALDLPAGSVVKLGLLALDAPAVIRGVVHNEAGEPVPGAMIRWSPIEEGAAHLFVRMPHLESVRAGPDGRFAIKVRARGKVRVHATGGPLVAIPGRKERLPVGTPVTVEVEPGATGLEIVVR